MKRAFTIAELMISVVIIMILAALVFSAAVGAKTQAKAVICMSNLRQIQAALFMYDDDNGHYPINSMRNRAFLPYFKGSPPICPLAGRFGKGVYNPSYYLTGSFDLIFDGKEEAACHTKRGDMFPLAYDNNHEWAVAAQATGDAFTLFIRENGAVGRIGFKQHNAFELNSSQFPCPNAPYWANF